MSANVRVPPETSNVLPDPTVMLAASTVPPFMSAVVAVRSAIVTPPPLAITIASSPSVNSISGVCNEVVPLTIVPVMATPVIAAAVVPPITAPSIVPPLMSAVVNTALGTVTTPVD